MKVLKEGSGQQGWSTKSTCTGKGNGGGGCKAELLVEEVDLYQTSLSDYLGDTDYFATYTCPECGVETDLENVPSNILSKLKRKKKPQTSSDTENQATTKPPIERRNTPISFYLGSGSKIKVTALENAISSLKIHGYIYPVREAVSAVNEQPVGEEEILRGAINRVFSARSIRPDGEIYVAIENGIEKTEVGDWVDYAIVLAFAPAYGVISYVKSQAVVFPSEQVEKTAMKDGGFAANTVGKTLKEDGVVNFHDDPHLDLAGISRREILKEALKELMRRLNMTNISTQQHSWLVEHIEDNDLTRNLLADKRSRNTLPTKSETNG
jgi:non-canonical (house-cleaning) NTP pyrophosphatase